MSFQSCYTLFNKLAILALLLIIYTSSAAANSSNAQHASEHIIQNLTFTSYSTADGLSSTEIFSILQDSRGLMWFGTRDGLNRFDGYRFKVYRHDPKDDTSLSNSFIWKLFEDSTGILWIATTGGGLDRYNPESDTFTHFNHIPGNSASLPHVNIKSFFEDKSGVLWVGSNGGLSRFNRESETFFTYRHNAEDVNSLSANSVRTILKDRKTGLFWLGCRRGGITTFNPDTKQFARYHANDDDISALSNDNVNQIYQDSSDNLWICTRSGLNRYDYETGEFVRYLNNPAIPGSLRHNWVWMVHEDSKGRFWVATQNGLDLLDRETGVFTHYIPDLNNPRRIKGKEIRTLYEDPTGAVWFGSFGNGISRLSGEAQKFTVYRHNPSNVNSLASNNVTALDIDTKGDLWIGTDNGLNHFDGQTFTRFQHDPDTPNSLSDNTVTTIAHDSRGIIWIGTKFGGLDRFDGNSFQHFNHDPHNPDSLKGNDVYALHIDTQGVLWIILKGIGLDRFNGNHFSHYDYVSQDNFSTHTYLGQIFETSNNTLWFSSNYGLLQFNTSTGLFHPSRLAMQEGVYDSCYQGCGETVWVTSPDELIQFDLNQQKTVGRYPTNLRSMGRVTGLLDDCSGNVWMTFYSAGIISYHLSSKTYKKYNGGDGLPEAGHNLGAYASAQNGMFYFGGPNGLTTFHPQKIHDNLHVPPIIFSRFLLYNKTVPIGVDSPLKTTIWTTNTLTLSPTENIFSLEFAALDYEASQSNKYRYRLDGFEKKWTETDSAHRLVTYTNLDPGNYRFLVKASNNDGVWNEEGISMSIVITPFWWETTWFNTLTFVLICVLVCGGFIWQRQNAKHREKLLAGQVEARTRDLELARKKSETANRAKSLFLANMSHELRTPLNAILGFSKMMVNEQGISPSQQKRLDTINSSGEYLLAMINDILDISKIEAGQMSIHNKWFDLHRTLRIIEELISPQARKKGLLFIVEQPADLCIYIGGDEQKLHQILLNLLSNAIKFTKKGRVLLRVIMIDDAEKNHKENSLKKINLQFQIEDTGPGIPKQDQKIIFDAFVQTKEDQQIRKGTGMGLAISQKFAQMMGGDISLQSVVGKGSIFQVSIIVDTKIETEIETKRTLPPVKGLAPGQPIYKILVVDDNIENRTLLCSLLGFAGFLVQEATNGKEAVEYYKEQHWDLIWMDMRMPIMDGITATQEIRNIEQRRSTRGKRVESKIAKIPIIALTAHAFDDEKETFMTAGCNDLVTKPYHEEQIFDVLKRYLGVQYIYAESNNELSPDALTRESFADLPDDLQQELKQALLNLDVDLITDIIGRIHNLGVLNASVAAGLTILADEFQYDKIRDLIK